MEISLRTKLLKKFGQNLDTNIGAWYLDRAREHKTPLLVSKELM